MEVRLRRLLRQAAARPDRQRRAPRPLSRLLKLVYFVPGEARDATRDAVFAAGGGVIGDYECCSWYTKGTGTFVAREGAAPAVGDVGEEDLAAAVDALRGTHPYEEVAFDLYPLHTP